MSKHVTEWLSAYADGELRSSQLHHVEAHLAECEACQAELDSLEKLSDLLQNVPAAEFSPPERFAAQVSLRLPRQKGEAPRKKILEIGWWMIPVGLLAIWVFISSSLLVGDILSTANSLGLLTSVSKWIVFDTVNAAGWSSTLGQIGFLSGNSFELAMSLETFTRTSLLQITLQISIALLYLSWIAIWWARRRRQEHGQLLEG